MLASATLFGLMAFAAKVASVRLSGSEVAMVRMAVGLAPCLLIPRFRRSAFHFKRVDLLFYRGFFGGLAVLLYFVSIAHTSVGIATLMNYTSPLFSGICSALFIGERMSARVLIPLPIALAGIVLVVQAHATPGGGVNVWTLVGLASGISSGAAVSAIRAARRTESSWAVYTSFCLIGLLMALPSGIGGWITPTPKEWLALAAMALTAIGAQLLMTFSLRWVDAMTVGVISQLAVLVSMALGACFLGEVVTSLAAVGTVLTIGGVVGVMYVTSLSTPRASADAVAPEA